MDPQRMHQETLILVALAIVVVSGVVAYLKRGRLGAGIEALGRFFSPEPKVNGSTNWNLFWISFAALFIEIMMIRWIGTEVRVFAYFQNLALIACFLGFGLGCYWAGRHKSLIFSLFGIVGLVILAEAPLRTWQDCLIVLSGRLSVSPDAAMWGYRGEMAGPMSWFLLLLASIAATTIFLLLLLIAMIPLGQWTGFYLDRATNPIQAYSANLLGSVAGIWIFAGMSFLWLPPVYWFVLAVALLVLMPPVSWRLGVAALIAVVCIFPLVRHSHHPDSKTYWSPYQRLDIQTLGNDEYGVYVNNTGYMGMANVTPDFLRRN